MKNAHFIEAAAACLSNGERLIEDARWLPEESAATKFALATIAQEEFAKAFLLFLVSRDVLTWNSLILRVTRDHASKHLLGHVMNYLNPAWEDFEARLKEWNAHHKLWEKLIAEYKKAADKSEKHRIWNQIQELNETHRDPPDSVRDAINILRYEKVGRWESSTWVWSEDPSWNPLAKDIADKKLDLEKQDALYVRIGANGGLSKAPNEVRANEAASALELARRLGDLVMGLLTGNDVNSIAYERIEASFKALFGGQPASDH